MPPAVGRKYFDDTTYQVYREKLLRYYIGGSRHRQQNIDSTPGESAPSLPRRQLRICAATEGWEPTFDGARCILSVKYPTE